MRPVPTPILLEIFWNRLISVVDEAAAALVRTAFSTIIRESHDYACVLFDAQGRSLAQSTTSVPSFIGTMPNTLKHFMSAIGTDGWSPGDVVITNDPWIGSGHLQDISMAAPIFGSDGALIGFSGVVAHPPDMGGRWTPSSQEIYEEGLQVPISKLMKEGIPNADVFSFIRQNVRVPDQVIGDLHAMMAACSSVSRRLQDLMAEAGLRDLDTIAQEIHSRSEEAMRSKISDIPDGRYVYEFQMDGFDQPITIATEMRVQGSDITIDYSGSSSQLGNALNCPWVYTNAYTVYTLKCAINPSVPNNEGALRPFDVIAPSGSILNPRFPAAVGARNLTGHQLSSAVFGALSQAVPANGLTDRVLAESGSPRPLVVIRGTVDDRAFATMVFVMGGMGARPNKDGIPCIAFPATTRNVSIEVLETTTPMLVEKKVFRPDSGGPGEYRGGDGQEMVLRVTAPDGARLSLFADRRRFPPRGLCGGGHGAGTHISLDGKELSPKGVVHAKKGQVLTILSPGGGGFGPPSERKINDIQRDLSRGVLSLEVAKHQYPHFDRPAEGTEAGT